MRLPSALYPKEKRMNSSASLTARSRTASHMLIACGPSGVGKSTLLTHLLTARPTCTLSRSTTTRAPRGNERNGVEYDFVDVDTFRRRIEAGAFAEYADVFGNYYGTPHTMIHDAIAEGRDVLFDIDIQGARNLKAQYPGAWCVAIAPPSFEILEHRLRSRGTDAPDVIEKRLAKARFELSQEDLFDFVLINDRLDQACDDICRIYDVMRQRAARVTIL